MFAQIKHAAIYTQNPQSAIAFYEKILGMKRITSAVTENNRGHISDGLIGLAVLPGGLAFPRGWIISASKSTMSTAPASG